jgi:membrane protein YqaA with SNARE-associated domain
MIEFIDYGLIGLFLASFLAATIIPFSSEAVLVAMLAAGFDPILCVIWATIGNWLGGMVSFFMGYLGKVEWLQKWFNIEEQKLNNFKNKVDRYGIYLALGAWLPIVGDLIAIALGFFRAHAYKVAVLMLVGKLARYIVLALLTLEVKLALF